MQVKKLEIQNRRAEFDYAISDKLVAGVVLKGTEVKALREGKGNLQDSFCYLRKGEIFMKGMHIPEYSHGNVFNHAATAVRKLLLNKREIRRLSAKTKERGYTIVPIRVFENERGLVKIEIGLARGKKTFDKRQSIKTRESKREMDRAIKNYR